MASETLPPIVPDERTQFAVLLVTDICDSTALKSQHGVLEYKKVAELHNRLFESLAAEEKLTLIKNTGDGYFARSTSVAAVVRFALRFQHGMRTMAWPGFPITTRVGIHAGEVVDITTLGQADVLAPAADLVARVMGLAVGGQILLTRGPFDEARHFVRAHPQVGSGEAPMLTWLAHGPYLFKGCEEPVEVFEVGAAEGAPLTAPPDGEKAKRMLRPGEEETLGWRPAGGLEVPGRAEWVLVRKLGEGGFGEVWLARHRTLKDQRVFKFCFDADKVRSLKREVTLFRVLRDRIGSSAGIVAVHDVFFDAPPYFIVMDFIDGPDLAGWAATHLPLDSVPLETRLEIIAQVADALQSAHDAGVIHRDVKPSNVLIEEKDGPPRARLTDFGIGQLVSGDTPAGIMQIGFTTTMSNEDSLTGTQLYLAPEMLAGQPATIRSDIYALGVMLYQLATGALNRPLTSDWSEDIADPLLREDIRNCVAGDPAKRFAGGAQLSAHVRALPRRRAEMEAAERLRARAARRKRQVRLVSFAAAAVVLVAIFLAFAFARERGLKVKIAEEGRRAEAGEAKANATLGRLRGTAPTFFAQAQALIEKQQFADALEKITYAIELNPDEAEYHNVKGNLLEDLSLIAEARNAYTDVLQRNPGHAFARENLNLCADILRGEEGHAELSKASVNKLNLLMRKQGRAAEAIATVRVLSKDRQALYDTWKTAFAKAGWPFDATRAILDDDGLFRVDLHDPKLDDISFLHGMPVKSLSLGDSKVSSLRPLEGVPLRTLNLGKTAVTDLTPLRGMKLNELNLHGTRVTDLSPLQGMPLEKLILLEAKGITDLSPLRGMPLQILDANRTSVTDIRALQGMPLSNLHVRMLSNVTPIGDYSVLKGMRLTEFDPGIGFRDNDLALLKGMPMETLKLDQSNVSDLRPLQGMPLKGLSINSDASHKRITDLSPLAGMRLTMIDVRGTPITDLSPLRGQPITKALLEGIPATDFSVIATWPLTDDFNAGGTQFDNLRLLAGKPVKALSLESTPVSDISLLRGMRIRSLHLWGTKVTDLHPLADLPDLEQLTIPTEAADIEFLRHLPNLQKLDNHRSQAEARPAADFWKEYDAKQAAGKK